jgi:hypothetical protein
MFKEKRESLKQKEGQEVYIKREYENYMRRKSAKVSIIFVIFAFNSMIENKINKKFPVGKL